MFPSYFVYKKLDCVTGDSFIQVCSKILDISMEQITELYAGIPLNTFSGVSLDDKYLGFSESPTNRHSVGTVALVSTRLSHYLNKYGLSILNGRDGGEGNEGRIRDRDIEVS